MTQLVSGFRHWGADARCGCCGDDYLAVEADGQPDTYLVRCWCGATARVRKDDPALARLVAPGHQGHA